MLKARCPSRCKPTTVAPEVPEAPSPWTPLSDSVTAPTTTGIPWPLLHKRLAWLRPCRVPGPPGEGGGSLKRTTEQEPRGRNWECCYIGEGSPFTSTEHSIDYGSRTRERTGTWGLYVLLSLGESCGITNVQADGSSLGNDSGRAAWEEWKRKQTSPPT